MFYEPQQWASFLEKMFEDAMTFKITQEVK